MLDRNNQVIRRGSYVRYEGKVYRVRYIFFRTIILDDGEKSIVLKAANLTYPVLNLEVVGSKQNCH